MSEAQSNSDDSLFERTKPREFRESIGESVNATLNNFFNTQPQLVDVECPFCLEKTSTFHFESQGLKFVRCTGCDSIYNSPRVTPEGLKQFYAMQPAQAVDSDMLPEVKQQRVEQVMRPRWLKLKKYLKNAGIVFPVDRIMEVGAGIGHFIEVIQETDAANRYVAVEPAQACQEPLLKLFDTDVVNSFLEEVSPEFGSCDLLFLNSVIEHPHSLDSFLQSAKQLLKPGGVISLVDMHSGGLDLELLRADAQNINPMFILQVGSVEGIKALCERNGLELIDIFSMGDMDIDILYEYSKNLDVAHSLYGLSYFLKEFGLRNDLQEVLREHLATGYNGYLLRNPS